MPLFTSKRDAGFLLGVNREIMHGFSSVEVQVYKLNLNSTQTNIYEESANKIYYSPVRLYAQVTEDEKSMQGDDILDFSRTLSVGFLLSDLEAAGIVIEEGDILSYDDGFYEINQVTDIIGWAGRHPGMLLGDINNEWKGFGYGISIVAQCHLTRTNSLNIVEVRKGITNSIDNENSIDKFM
jgi:hypothetical protein